MAYRSSWIPRAVSLLLGLCMTAASHSAQNSEAHALDAYIEEVIARWGVPGMSVAVISDGKVALAKGYGVTEVGTGERVDGNTVFPIGSMSKSFTSTAAAMLVDEGKLDWDTAAREFLPALRFADPWLTAHTTVRDLAANRVGVDEDFAWLARSWDTDQVIERMSAIEPTAPFRSFLYSNTGYAALGAITSKVAGQPWNDLIAVRLLAPLGMSRSGTGVWAYVQADRFARCWACTPKVMTLGRAALLPGVTNMAAPHGISTGVLQLPGTRDRRAVVLPWHYENAGPAAGAVTSTANDMARYLSFHLNEGVIDGRRLLAQALMRDLHTRQVLTTVREVEDSTQSGLDVTGYALGWRKRIYHGHDVSAHAGGQVGFGSMMWLVPEKKLAIVVMQNLDFQAAPAHQIVAQRLVDHYLGLPTTDWNARAEARWGRRAQRAPKFEIVAGVPSDIAALAGRYRSAIMGEVEVRSDGDGVWLQFEPHSRAKVQPLKNGDLAATFEGTETNPIQLRLRFDLGDDGKATAMRAGEISLGTTPLYFSRVPAVR